MFNNYFLYTYYFILPQGTKRSYLPKTVLASRHGKRCVFVFFSLCFSVCVFQLNVCFSVCVFQFVFFSLCFSVKRVCFFFWMCIYVFRLEVCVCFS